MLEFGRLHWWLALLSLAALASLSLAQQDSSRMKWIPANDSRALCNDFTRAGFFLRTNTSSDRWIIFLESGSLCFSAETCNRRFFRSEFRGPDSRCSTPSEAPVVASFNAPFGNRDPAEIQQCLLDQGLNFSEYVNPLMTSMECLDRGLFGANFTVEGRDMLSTNPSENSDFYAHNHVLIPYCSSDLWLASEEGQEECQCGDLSCFGYQPNARELQFAFRGKIIFQTIFRQLLGEYGMDGASQVLVGGSSAGGVGAVNLAQWVRSTMPPQAELLVLVDSAWFINFQGGIFRVFDGTVNQEEGQGQGQNDSRRLFSIVRSHEACADMSLGFPCCVSAHCVMTTTRNDSGALAYFPESGVRSFFLSSVYDVFLLAPAVSGLDDFGAVSGGNTENTTSLLIDFLRVVGEYGGEMNFTLAQAFNKVPSLSYYLTQCFQHIYLATTTLWGPPEEMSVFGNSAIELGEDLASFSHTIELGRWNLTLSSDISPQTAVSSWLLGTEQRRFLDACQGPYCNDACPDRFVLGNLTSNSWPLWSKIVIIVVLVGIAMLCLVMKMLFTLWLFRLEKKQENYLDSLDDQLSDECSTLVFPQCRDANRISVSCLDLTYKVSFKINKNVKDETKDQTQAVVLNELTEAVEESAKDSPVGRRLSRNLLRRNRFSHLAETLIRRSSHVPAPVDSDPEMTLTSYNIPSPPPPPPMPLPPVVPPQEEIISNSCGCQTKRSKEILKGISIYFNPKEMIGIMGPSGSGKTTLLDLLTGRRRTGTIGGNIYINGIPMDEIRDWYIANTGYVLQLARPYYEELTVRDNLTLAAQIKLPETDSFTYKDKFKRVEQVMDVTGLTALADTVVGGETGAGLSGGQKRRLVVALQLLRVPSVIFLDEPTSGLDATSSMELLSHLNRLADTERTVILTIHQPRFEIFHMFTKLVLISEGKIAYHGAPEKAFEVFVSALHERYLEQGLLIPALGDHNPADVIMDMLGNPRFRQILTEYYQDCDEPKLVRHAVKVARWEKYSQSSSSVDSIGSAFQFAVFGAKKVGQRHAHTFTRMAAMEARATKRIRFTQLLFLPFVFFVFAVVLGTVYLQQTQAFLVVSGMCVFSVASGLFVFPAIEIYYTPAIRVYTYERADGVGRSQDLVLQGFIKYISLAFLPVVASTAIMYLLLIHQSQYDVLVFLQVAVVNIALNLTWTALLISLMLALPNTAFRLSSGIASVFGFTSGFFIPIGEIPWWYRWISYINPNYYGFSSVAFFLLEDFDSGCVGSDLECYFSSGPFTLRMFNFENVNPYLHLLILLGFSLFFLCLAMFVNWARHTSVGTKVKRLVDVIFRVAPDEFSKELKSDRAGFERSLSTAGVLDEGEESFDEYEEEFSPVGDATTPLYPIVEEDEERGGAENPATKVKMRSKWQNIAEKSLEQEEEGHLEDSVASTGSGWGKIKMVRIQEDPRRPTKLTLDNRKLRTRRKKVTPFLSEGETHMVWRPKKRPQLANLVELLAQSQDNNDLTAKKPPIPEIQTPKPTTPQQSTTKPGPSLLLPTPTPSPSLRSRQKTLFNRVFATQAVLKEHTDEILNDDKNEEELSPRHMTLLQASKKVTANLKRQKSETEEAKSFSEIVTQFLAKSKGEEEGAEPVQESSVSSAGAAGSKWGALRSKKPVLARKETRGAIPIQALRELVREGKKQAGGPDDPLKRRSTGGVNFADLHAATPSNGHAPSLADDPPREVKMNKMAQLKMKVAERHLQKQDTLDVPPEQVEITVDTVLADSAHPEPVTSPPLNSNSNNSNNSAKVVKWAGLDAESAPVEARRSTVSGSLLRPPKPTNSALRRSTASESSLHPPPQPATSVGGKSADIFISKSSQQRQAGGRGKQAREVLLSPGHAIHPPRLQRQGKPDGSASHDVVPTSIHQSPPPPQTYNV